MNEIRLGLKFHNLEELLQKGSASDITDFLTGEFPQDVGYGWLSRQKALAYCLALTSLLVEMRDLGVRALPLTDMSGFWRFSVPKEKLNIFDIRTLFHYFEPVPAASLIFPLKNPQAKEPAETEQITDEWEECHVVKRHVNANIIDAFKSVLLSLGYNSCGKPPTSQPVFLEQLSQTRSHFILLFTKIRLVMADLPWCSRVPYCPESCQNSEMPEEIKNWIKNVSRNSGRGKEKWE